MAVLREWWKKYLQLWSKLSNFLAFFIGGLIFMTYALTLRGDVINEFGKPGSKTAAPPSGSAPAPAPASAPAPAEKK